MSSLSIVESKLLPDALSDTFELRPFAQVKLIAFDLDGTLIKHVNELPGQRLSKLFSIIAHSNVKLTLATGRSLAGVNATLGQLQGLNRIPLVLYNGSVVIRPDERALIAHKSISPDVAMSIATFASDCSNVSAFFYCVNTEAGLFDSGAPTENVYLASHQPTVATVEFNGMPLLPLSELEFSTAKVVAILLEVTQEIFKAYIQEMLRGFSGISVTTSGTRYLEIRPMGSSKAEGLKVLCNQFGIGAENVLAMGDNDNDVELLSWAGLSVCVHHSSDAARRASKFYSTHGAGRAAIEVLEIVRRSQRLFKEGKWHGGFNA